MKMKYVLALMLVLSAPICRSQPFLITVDLCREYGIDSVTISEVAYNSSDTTLDKAYKYERASNRLFWDLPTEPNNRQWLEFTTEEGRIWTNRMKEQFAPLSDQIPNTAFERMLSIDTAIVERDSTQRILSILSYNPNARADRLLHTYSYSSGGISDSSFVVFGNGSTKWLATNLYIIGPNDRTICMIGTTGDNTAKEEYHVFYGELGLPTMVRYVKDGVIWYDSVYQYYFE